jgi:hypothetical protein
MIVWVNARMEQWGEWMAGRNGRGAGGPAFPAYQLVHIRGTAGSEMLCDPDVMQLDRIMSHVKQHRPELYETAHGRYVQGLSNALLAGRMRCHVNTVYARMNFLHRFVEKRLAANVPA